MHFLVMVIGENIEEQMDPYYQDLEVDEYLVGDMSETDKERMMDYYKSKGFEFVTFDECYEENGYDWDGGRCRKDEDGVWREYSTYNQDAEWDWYEIGGRWAGRIVLKEGAEYKAPNFSWGWSKEDKKKVLKERRVDTALLKEIENTDCLSAYVILKDGVWHYMGDEDAKSEETKKLMADVTPETRITFVDCHM